MTSSRFFTSEDDPSRYLRVGSDLIRGRGQPPAAPYLGAFGSSAVHGERHRSTRPWRLGGAAGMAEASTSRPQRKTVPWPWGWAARVWRSSHSCCSSCTPGGSRANEPGPVPRDACENCPEPVPFRLCGSILLFVPDMLLEQRSKGGQVLERADRFVMLGLILLVVEPAFILFTINLVDLGLLALGLGSCSSCSWPSACGAS